MMKVFKNPTIIGLALIGVVAIVAYGQSRNRSSKLSKCSIYTVGDISRVHTNRAIVYATYQYRLNGRIVEATEGVNNFDTDEDWTVDMRKLSRRRLLLQVYCDDINVNRIIWDVPVPDTLQYIPINGWKEIPFKRKVPN